jgi:hypothetical protein
MVFIGVSVGQGATANAVAKALSCPSRHPHYPPIVEQRHHALPTRQRGRHRHAGGQRHGGHLGPGRAAKFEGEMFLSMTQADALGHRFLDFFQLDRDGRPKGIVQIDLKGIP